MQLMDGVLKEIADLKFKDVKQYESRGRSIFADHFIIATADNTVQMEAARNNLVEFMKKNGIRLKNPMEDWHGGWCLLDFGNIIVHIFMEESRRFYDLDSLFESYNFNPADIVETPAKGKTDKKEKKPGKRKAAKKKPAGKKAPAKKVRASKPAAKKTVKKKPAKKTNLKKKKK